MHKPEPTDLPDRAHAGWAGLVSDVARGLDEHDVAVGQLGEYALVFESYGEREAARRFARLALHLASGCSECEADLAELRAFARELAAERSHAVDTASAEGDGWFGLKRMIGQLVIGTAAPQFALRGLDEHGDAPRVYTVDDVVVTLEARASAARFQLSGTLASARIDPLDLVGVAVRLRSADGAIVANAQLDEVASFRMNDLDAGTYGLEFRLPDGIVQVDQVRLVG